MPAENVKRDQSRIVVRYSCYICTERWWTYLDEVHVEEPEHNTIMGLCDCCHQLYEEWRDGKTKQEESTT